MEQMEAFVSRLTSVASYVNTLRVGLVPHTILILQGKQFNNDEVSVILQMPTILAKPAFPCMENIDLQVRPIHHRPEERVRAHVFLCMLVDNVEWHMRRAWAPLLFAEDDPQGADARRRSPVAPATRSTRAANKASTRRTPDGHPVHRFRGMLAHMATLTKNTLKPKGGQTAFDRLTVSTDLQRRAFELLEFSIPT